MTFRISALSIPAKIGLIGLAGIVGVVLLGAGFGVSEKLNVAAYGELVAGNATFKTLSNIDSAMLLARYAEKEFIIQPHEKHVETQQQARTHLLKGLEQLMNGRGHVAVADIKVVADGVQRYFEHWDKFVALNRELGFSKDSGALATHRNASEAVAGAVMKALGENDVRSVPIVEMLWKMRREEMELLARSENKYVGKVQESANKLRKLIDASDLPAQAKSDLGSAIDAYLSAFSAMASRYMAAAEDAGKFKLFHRPAKAALDKMIGDVSVGANASNARFDSIRQNSFLAVAALIFVVLGAVASLAVTIGRGISRPIVGMTRAMDVLAKGDTGEDIPGVGRKDEIGAMASSVQVFKSNMIENQRLASEKEAEQRASEQRAARRDQGIAGFDRDVTGLLQTVSSAITQTRTIADRLSHTADDATSRASAVLAASEQSSANVQTVATAAEELSASIGEISRQVAQSAEVSGTAVAEAERTNVQVQGLADAANKIGEVVSLISDIAEQTNLLALNATIEAARAGEAGKGFAVVASEVKNLANQTARATEEISAQIGDIQTATRQAVGAIGGISSTIGQINEIASAIAAAVEEQGAATGEIARNVQQAAAGTQDVTNNIGAVSESANQTRSAASEAVAAADSLTQDSESLRSRVDGFLAEMRAS